MRSFAIEEPGSPVPALYATLANTYVDRHRQVDCPTYLPDGPALPLEDCLLNLSDGPALLNEDA